MTPTPQEAQLKTHCKCWRAGTRTPSASVLVDMALYAFSCRCSGSGSPLPCIRLGCFFLAVLQALNGSMAASPSRVPRPDADDAAFVELSADGGKGTGPLQALAARSAQVASNALQSNWSWDTFHSQEAMTQYLAKLAADNALACSVRDVGLSVKGRRIVAIRVQHGAASTLLDAPNNITYAKPSFVWIGNMHGDETANRELLLRLAGTLCAPAASLSPRLRALLAAVTVHIIPSMNPDGYAALTRYNAQNVDLNRNFYNAAFPYYSNPALNGSTVHDSAAMSQWLQYGNFPLQPEAVAVSRYLRSVRPELSANLHGGEVVANYPMDACDPRGLVLDCPSLDEPVPRLLANAYAYANPPMWRNKAYPFVNGSVQGATWYPVLGSMQDWVYDELGLTMLTLELHKRKDPPAEDLASLWNANMQSMVRLMELSTLGLRARVLDSATGAPLRANVTVVRPAGVRGTAADENGYFFKQMAPGLAYEFLIRPFAPATAAAARGARSRSSACRVYEPISYAGRLDGSWDAVVTGQGLAKLTLVQTFLLSSLPCTKKLRQRQR